jgi:hypothetical protein
VIESGTTGLQTLQDSTVSVHGPLWLHLKPPKLLIFDFNADPDSALYSNADPDPALYSNADPDPASEGSGSAALVPTKNRILISSVLVPDTVPF